MATEPLAPEKSHLPILLASVFIIASCGILYELLISSISTYFLGSSILQFSITIGLFMFFMGVGSYFSRFFTEKLLDWFVTIEILLGFVGGLSALILYFSYSLTENYYLVAFCLIALLGILIGLEIPLVTRITSQYSSLKDTVAQIFSFDYIGALLASVIFPLVLLPYLGIMRTSFLIGLLNVAVALFNIQVFQQQLEKPHIQRNTALASVIALLVGFGFSFQISSFFEQFVYQDNVILSRQSAYQRIVLTEWNGDFRLFLNGSLQFSTTDEHRYHESLVHIPMSLANHYENILVLGGGDGLAVREILRYQNVKQIDLVDLDQEMTELGRENPMFRKLNRHSLRQAQVKLYHEDAFNFVKRNSKRYSVIIIDLPDPHDISLGKLYSKEFYEMIKKSLSADGIVVTQSTSPYFAHQAFWCIEHTIEQVFEYVLPYTAYVPSFGQWGFVMAMPNLPAENEAALMQHLTEKMTHKIGFDSLQFLTPDLIPSLFTFPKDLQKPDTIQVNRLDNQIIVQYYEKSLKKWE